VKDGPPKAKSVPAVVERETQFRHGTVREGGGTPHPRLPTERSLDSPQAQRGAVVALNVHQSKKAIG